MTTRHPRVMNTAASRSRQITAPVSGGSDRLPRRHVLPFPAPRLDPWEVVEFAEMWSPFGGPPAEEIFVRFGMSPERFSRVLAASADQIADQLRPDGQNGARGGRTVTAQKDAAVPVAPTC